MLAFSYRNATYAPHIKLKKEEKKSKTYAIEPPNTHGEGIGKLNGGGENRLVESRFFSCVYFFLVLSTFAGPSALFYVFLLLAPTQSNSGCRGQVDGVLLPEGSRQTTRPSVRLWEKMLINCFCVFSVRSGLVGRGEVTGVLGRKGG